MVRAALDYPVALMGYGDWAFEFAEIRRRRGGGRGESERNPYLHIGQHHRGAVACCASFAARVA
eukprot:CAMPEP_0119535346 /NCGR_PEP_ID=MMETSP1344-20130328/48400_1 /TAXON_ID=236787 /ORGANISM="Florenciella parvula, Strain CCMP2471" /LENGTH=63 /DNA_ID=CAMNT_0007576931 /DNA_START=34 /DNA_END=220 /DNA_ORIENTATION=+